MAVDLTTLLSSHTRSIAIHRAGPTVIIGERINPTGRKAVLEALQRGEFDQIRRDALDQIAAGAQILDVNAGVPGADEADLLTRLLDVVMEATDAPLCIDTADPHALARALERYPGKALINSVNGEEHSLGAVLPLARDHGAAVIGLCMDEEGIPGEAAGRLKVAEKILNRAAQTGIDAADVILDPLALTMGADSQAGRVALDTTRLLVEEFGVNVTLGASNISFGLPDRRRLNATFLAMAISAGVTCPITNPLEESLRTTVLAADLIMGRDEYGMNWIQAYRGRAQAEGGTPPGSG